MDIYEWAENNNCNADYLDPHTGYIYKVQEYGTNRKFNENAKIRIVDVDTGQTIGYASKN